MRSVAKALITHEKIKTTEAKAKEIRPIIEKLVTFAKNDIVANRRQTERFLAKEEVKKLFDKIGPRYKSREGGYTRIIKMPPQRHNRARMAFIEFV